MVDRHARYFYIINPLALLPVAGFATLKQEYWGFQMWLMLITMLMLGTTAKTQALLAVVRYERCARHRRNAIISLLTGIN